jgi:hypothetical protein
MDTKSGIVNNNGFVFKEGGYYKFDEYIYIKIISINPDFDGLSGKAKVHSLVKFRDCKILDMINVKEFGWFNMFSTVKEISQSEYHSVQSLEFKKLEYKDGIIYINGTPIANDLTEQNGSVRQSEQRIKIFTGVKDEAK